MNKLFPIIIVGVLIVSGFGTLAINVENKKIIQSETITELVKIDTSSLKIIDSDKDYLSVNLGSEELYLMNPAQPFLRWAS